MDAFLWGLVIIVVLFLLYHLFGKRKPKRRSKIYRLYAEADGNTPTATTNELIRAPLEDANAADHVRVGTVFLTHYADADRAATLLQTATNLLRMEIEHRDNIDETKWAYDRINDLHEQYDIPADDMLPEIQVALFEMLENIPMPTQTGWVSDSQNVHDSVVNNEMNQQVNQLAAEYMHLLDTVSYADIRRWILTKTNPEKIKPLLDIFDNNYRSNYGSNLHEQDIVKLIWLRIHDPRNASHQDQLLEAFIDCVNDCIEQGKPVCIDGRPKKLMQCFAKIDFDPDMGMFHTKQAIRDEIHKKASDIIETELKQTLAQTRESYNRGETTPEIVVLQNAMRAKIAQMVREYEGKLPPADLSMIGQVCVDQV